MPFLSTYFHLIWHLPIKNFYQIMSQELRRRNLPKRDETSSNGAMTTLGANAKDTVEKDVREHIFRGIRWLSAMVHVAAVLMVVYGVVLRMSFHSGVECDMTYSMRHFVLLTQNVPQHSVYRLFKFTDLRDVRQSHLHPKDNSRYNEWSASSSQNWCTLPHNANTTIVLYVPGHWGSFSQARSLGAHGLQWTRARDNVNRIQREVNLFQSGKWNGRSQHVSNFVYDVYAIDFREQGGALHANFLYAQSEYVAQVVMTLVKECGNPNVILVGHSMGGLVARSVPLLHPETHPHVQNLITLATPHGGLPYAFDESLPPFYELLATSDYNSLTTISISGGMRDEMMPPEACRLAKDNHKSISLLATDSSMNGLGMDHRAIVWCHYVLERVRKILHIMATQEDPVERKRQLESLLPTDEYSSQLNEQREAFRQQFGFWRSAAMESAMLYRAELLLGLYAMTAGVYHAIPRVSLATVPLIVGPMAWLLSDVDQVFVVMILSVVANTVHWLVSLSVGKILPRREAKHKQTIIAKRHVLLFVSLFMALQLVAASLGYAQEHSRLYLFPQSAVFVSSILFLPVASFFTASRDDPSNVTFLSLFLPVWPFLVVGKLFMVAWNVVEEFPGNSLGGLSRFQWLVCLPVYLRIIFYSQRQKDLWMRRYAMPCLCVLVAVIFAPRMVQHGGGYVVGYFLSSVAWIDVLVAIQMLCTTAT